MIGIIITLVAIIVSVVFAIVNNEVRSASLWALWAIFLAIFFGAHYTLP